MAPVILHDSSKELFTCNRAEINIVGSNGTKLALLESNRGIKNVLLDLRVLSADFDW